MKTASMSTRRIGRVGLMKGCAFASAAVAIKKRLFCSKCDDQILLKFAHHPPLGSGKVW